MFRCCLFCKQMFTAHSSLFDHMAFDHNFSVGQPANIVFANKVNAECLGRFSIALRHCRLTHTSNFIGEIPLNVIQGVQMTLLKKGCFKFIVDTYFI